MVSGDLYKTLEIRFTRVIQLSFNFDTVSNWCYNKKNQGQEARHYAVSGVVIFSHFQMINSGRKDVSFDPVGWMQETPLVIIRGGVEAHSEA